MKSHNFFEIFGNMFALLISKVTRKIVLYHKLKMFPVQIQWGFARTVPFSSTAGGISAVTASHDSDRTSTPDQLAGLVTLHIIENTRRESIS